MRGPHEPRDRLVPPPCATLRSSARSAFGESGASVFGRVWGAAANAKWGGLAAAVRSLVAPAPQPTRCPPTACGARRWHNSPPTDYSPMDGLPPPQSQRPLTRQAKRTLEEEKITVSLPSVPVSSPVVDPHKHTSLPQPLRTSPFLKRAPVLGSLMGKPDAPAPAWEPIRNQSSAASITSASQIIPFMQMASQFEPEPALAIWRANDKRLMAFNERFLKAFHISEEYADGLSMSLSDIFNESSGSDTSRELLQEVRSCGEKVSAFFEKVQRGDGSIPPTSMRITVRLASKSDYETLQFALSMVSLQGEPRILWIVEEITSDGIADHQKSPIGSGKKRRQRKPWSAAVSKFSLSRPKDAGET